MRSKILWLIFLFSCIHCNVSKQLKISQEPVFIEISAPIISTQKIIDGVSATVKYKVKKYRR